MVWGSRTRALGWLFGIALAAAAPAQQPGLSAAQVAAECRQVLDEARKNGLAVGFAAASAESGESILRSNGDRLLVPASNMKIVSAGAALFALGPDHAIYTDLVAHGTQADGILHGRLRLRGEGDPTLRGAEVPGFLARKVREAGIARVAGDLVVDDRLFDREFIGPGWPRNSVTEEYMAEVAALSLDHGTVQLLVSAASEPGQPAHLALRPEGDGVHVVNRLVTCASKKDHLVDVSRPDAENVLTVSGKVAAGTRDQEFLVSIHDPPMVFGQALAHALRREGVVVDGRVRRAEADDENGGRLIVRLETKVADVLPVMMKASQNHRAEMLWKHLGVCRGEGGTFAQGASAARKVLEAAGVNLEGAVFADGSGLSRDDLVSADQLVAILKALWRSEWRRVFADSLAAGGESGGTLRHRLKDLGARLRAKTGSLRGVAALSGYVEAGGGATVAFSILTMVEKRGRMTGRDVQDRLVTALSRLREVP